MGFSSKRTTAILVFANSSSEELKHKPIQMGIHLFETLTEHTLELVAKTGLPYFHFSEEEQVGSTFGERYTNAIEAIFEKGYEQIITIGNDTPQLTTAHILKAEKQLSSNKLVLGPSTDGGFYLMGIHKSQFDLEVFTQFAWQTPKLFKQLIEHINQQNIDVSQLRPLHDIDSQKDVKVIVFFAHSLSKNLLRAFLKSLNLATKNYCTPQDIYQSVLTHLPHNKGSPTLFHS